MTKSVSGSINQNTINAKNRRGSYGHTWYIRLECLNMTPLGLAVVPDVYTSVAVDLIPIRKREERREKREKRKERNVRDENLGVKH